MAFKLINISLTSASHRIIYIIQSSRRICDLLTNYHTFNLCINLVLS